MILNDNHVNHFEGPNVTEDSPIRNDFVRAIEDEENLEKCNEK